VALAQAIAFLALDEFEKYRAQLVFAETLQQQRALFSV
jgi:hypothetical protein